MDSSSSAPPPAGQNGHAPTDDEVTAALIADIDTTLAAIRDDDMPEHWFQPGYLHMLAVAYVTPRVFGQMKAAYKRHGGNPYDLERAVKEYRATHGITATAPPGSARAFLEALKQRVLPGGPDAAPDYGCLYLPDVTARLQQIALDDETLYLGFFQPWVREQRGLFWPDEDRRVRAYREVGSLPFTLPHVPPPLMPPLPLSAVLDPALATGTGQWLDEYVAYSRQWSTRGADGFHEAVGVWMLSAMAARRICVHMGRPVYPSLFIAFIAPSSIYAKSTTAELGREGLKVSGGLALLGADRTTPQAFLRSMSGRVPPEFAAMDINVQDAMLARLAFAGQRAWFFDEWGGLLKQMVRSESPLAAFHELLKVLDDSRDSFASDTIQRGLELVSAPYLALLTCATPHDLEPFMRPGHSFWHDGFWPRFAMIAPGPDEIPSLTHRPPGLAVLPDHLKRALALWHIRLGIPKATVEPVLDAKGKPTGLLRRLPVTLPCTVMGLDPDVLKAYYAYGDALYSMAVNHVIAEDLSSCYVRFQEKSLRIALLLASLEDASSIALCHWVRAQQITEQWRLMLHQTVELVIGSRPLSREQQLEDRLVKLLERDGPNSARYCQRHIKGSTSGDITKALKDMLSVGRVMTLERNKSIVYALVSDTDAATTMTDDTTDTVAAQVSDEVPF